MSRLRADLLLFAVAALWGLAFVMQKSAMTVLEPLTFIAARATVASIALAPLALREWRRQRIHPPADFYRLAIAATVVFFLGTALQQTGLSSATVTNSSFLTALYAVITPFVSWVILRRAPSRVVWPAAALSFVGVWLLGGATVGTMSKGDALVALSAPFWAVHIVLTGLAAPHDRPILFTALQFAGIAVLAGAAASLFNAPSPAAIASAWREIAYVGIVSSALTFTIFSIAMRHAPPAEAAIIISTENLFAAAAAAVLLGERLQLINWLGAGLILAAILLVQTSGYRRAAIEATR